MVTLDSAIATCASPSLFFFGVVVKMGYFLFEEQNVTFINMMANIF
jgi:hypothetical protein